MSLQSGPYAFERVLWTKTAPPAVAFPRLERDLTADVVIIGGGYSGLSAALHLAEAGRAVVLLEADEPGAGASGRNAAGWMPGYLDQTPADIERLLGRERGAALNRLVAESGALLRQIIGRHGIAADVRPSGVLIATDRAQDLAAARALQGLWTAAGGSVELVAGERVRALTGSLKFSHGLLYREAGTLNPLALARGLAAAAAAAGALVHTQSPAERIGAAGAGWRVDTALGCVTARHVLIATEGYAANKGLWPGLERTVYHIPAAMIASRPAPALADFLLPGDVPVGDTNKSNHLWLMADPERRIVASLLPPRHDAATPAEVARPLEAKLRRIHGPLPAIDWEHFWIGTVAVSRERIPRLLRLAAGVHALGGYSGQGITAATAAGKEYAAFVVADGDESACRLPVFDPRPLPLQRVVPSLVRSVLAPLSRAADRSYRNHSA